MSASNPWDVSQILLQNRVGEIWGNALQNIGEKAGSAIEKYSQIKKQNQEMQGVIDQQTDTLKAMADNEALPKDQRDVAAQALVRLHDPNLSVAQKHAVAQQSASSLSNMLAMGYQMTQAKLLAAQTQQQQFANWQNIEQYNRMRGMFGGSLYPQGAPGAAPAAPSAPSAPAQPSPLLYAPPPMQGTGAPATMQGTGLPAALQGMNPIAVYGNKAAGTAIAGGDDVANAINQFSMNYGRAYGTLPPAELVNQFAKLTAERENIVGYKKGDTVPTEGGLPQTQYFPTYRKGDGSIRVDKEPIIMHGGNAPGLVLDPAALDQGKVVVIGGPNPAQQPQNLATSPTGAPQIQYTKDQQEARLEISQDLGTIQDSRIRLKELKDAHEAMVGVGRRWGWFSEASGRLEPVEKLMGDPTGERLNSVASTFVAGLMGADGKGGVKNIRNINEFKAVTASIPTSIMAPQNRLKFIADTEAKLDIQEARNKTALDLINRGAMPSAAWEQAYNQVKNAGVEGIAKFNADVKKSAANQPPPNRGNLPVVRTQEDYDKLPLNAWFHTPSGKMRHKQ